MSKQEKKNVSRVGLEPPADWSGWKQRSKQVKKQIVRCLECGNEAEILRDGTLHCEHCLPKKSEVETPKSLQEHSVEPVPHSTECLRQAKTGKELRKILIGTHPEHHSIEHLTFLERKWILVEVAEIDKKEFAVLLAKVLKEACDYEEMMETKVKGLEETMRQWKAYHLEKVKGLEAENAELKGKVEAFCKWLFTQDEKENDFDFRDYDEFVAKWKEVFGEQKTPKITAEFVFKKAEVDQQ